MDYRTRYLTAGLKYIQETAPFFYEQSGGPKYKLKVPDTSTANGLTAFITQFLTWEGHRATRVNVMGRMINGKMIKSSTRRGSADISATVSGRSVMLEIKINSDRPSPAQLKEQALERKAGGVYEFIKTADQFFAWYDGFMQGNSVQRSIFD